MALHRRVLLILTGGVAAYKALDLIRLIREAGLAVRCVMTRRAGEFVTPLSLAALSEDTVYHNLFDLTEESEMGHIRLSRESDLAMVAPCTANMMAKMAHGLADDLASSLLLATDKPVMIAPAMNVRMWEHPATQANAGVLRARGVTLIGPESGALACGDVGAGRMADPADLLAAIRAFYDGRGSPKPLAGRTALVTSGPTREPIDPARYIASRSSGKQGRAIAEALAALGAEVTLVSGPTALTDPTGMKVVRVETARDMLAACEDAAAAGLDVAVCAAAVADWGAVPAAQKLKKNDDDATPFTLTLRRNPDILATLSRPSARRPPLVVGFAAETERVIENARAKRARKGCDWICANDVSAAAGTFGGDRNAVHFITATGVESWPKQSKRAAAETLARRIADALAAMAKGPAA